jgi:uncharacterized repeat protein (TIGR03803 family)
MAGAVHALVILVFSAATAIASAQTFARIADLGGALGANQVFNTLISFDGDDGGQPDFEVLVQGADGNLYGTTEYDGKGFAGTVFKISREGLLATLHNFCSQSCNDGAYPMAGLTLATDGNFYGTTSSGGSNTCFGTGCGTVFKIDPAFGTLTTLYNFCSQPNCADGATPYAGLVQAEDGNFYGTTFSGGGGGCNSTLSAGCGTVFKITLAGTLTMLHSFDVTDGASPYAGLVQAKDGSFYGTTFGGGANDLGTIFKTTPDGILTTLHSFDHTDGDSPQAGLIQATDGSFYGTTANGGSSNNCPGGCGTVFKFTPGDGLKTLYNFKGSDGLYPYSALVQATDGNMYGTTALGGDLACDGSPSHGCGTIFKITPAGNVTTLHSFDLPYGVGPFAGLVQATNGNFYGATFGGGAYQVGTIFSLSTGLGPFVAFVRDSGKVGQTGGILGQGFTGTTSVSLNGIPAAFTVKSDTFITATVPPGATSGYVTVMTPSGTLTSNVPFRVLP